MGFSIINHPFWDTFTYGNPQMVQWYMFWHLSFLDLFLLGHLRFSHLSQLQCLVVECILHNKNNKRLDGCTKSLQSAANLYMFQTFSQQLHERSWTTSAPCCIRGNNAKQWEQETANQMLPTSYVCDVISQELRFPLDLRVPFGVPFQVPFQTAKSVHSSPAVSCSPSWIA